MRAQHRHRSVFDILATIVLTLAAPVAAHADCNNPIYVTYFAPPPSQWQSPLCDTNDAGACVDEHFLGALYLPGDQPVTASGPNLPVIVAGGLGRVLSCNVIDFFTAHGFAIFQPFLRGQGIILGGFPPDIDVKFSTGVPLHVFLVSGRSRIPLRPRPGGK